MHLGIELGIVINKHDPENRKRVQVFIPHLSNTLFEDWNKEDSDIIKFKNPNELPGNVLIRLKQTLPWAEAAVGIFGGGTSMTANTYNGNLGVNNTEGTVLGGTETNTPVNDVVALGDGVIDPLEGVPELDQDDRPDADFATPLAEMDFSTPPDTASPTGEAEEWFSKSNPNGREPNANLPSNPGLTDSTDPFAAVFVDNGPPPESYATVSDQTQENPGTEIFKIEPNSGKELEASQPSSLTSAYGAPNGTVSVPNEGAKVFVFFYGGDIQKPVYFASTVDY